MHGVVVVLHPNIALKIDVSKSKAKESEHRVMEHCSYRHSDFLLVDSSFNVLYRVVAFKHAQTVYTRNLNIEM